MTETKLKLVKNQKKQTPSISKAAEKQAHTSHITPQRAASPWDASERSLPLGRLTSLPTLTPAERAEAARFRALTAAKAARQAMLHQIMAELQELDETESAA
jgi:hypothetical protein